MIELDVQGLNELAKQIERLEDKLAGKTVYKAVSHALAPMQKEAKKRAPKAESTYRRYMSSGQGEKTFIFTKNGKKRKGKGKKAKRGTGKYHIIEPGLLRKSIKRRRLTKGKSKYAHGAVGAIYIAFPKEAKTHNSPFYWHMVEYGTKFHPAVPFLRPAFVNNTQKATDIFAQKLAKEIDKVTQG